MAGLPNSSLVAFVRQIFAFKNRHKFAWHLVGFRKRCELVLNWRKAWLDDWLGRLMESDLVQWLILVAVVARLHLRLLWGVSLVWLGPGFVDESGFNRWPLLGVLRSASVKVRDVWNRRRRLFTHNHHGLLKKSFTPNLLLAVRSAYLRVKLWMEVVVTQMVVV